MSTRLILIRHGETDWNLKKKYLGHSDINLNARGKRQAFVLSKFLDTKEIHKVYSSDLKRSAVFSKIIFKNHSIKKIKQLREINFGIFESKTYDEIIKKHPELFKEWVDHPFKAYIPEGERLIDFQKRVLRMFKDILLRNKNKTVAVVTHAGPIRMLVNNILDEKDIWKVNISNGSITIIERENKKLSIRLLNCVLNNDGVMK